VTPRHSIDAPPPLPAALSWLAAVDDLAAAIAVATMRRPTWCCHRRPISRRPLSDAPRRLPATRQWLAAVDHLAAAIAAAPMRRPGGDLLSCTWVLDTSIYLQPT
jgi:hypothetical protein